MLNEIQRLVEQYLAGEISLADFSPRFGVLYALVRQDRSIASRAAAQVCNAIIGPFAEHSRGHRSEASLKEELVNAIRPFAQKESAPSEATI